jgi:hypothetical protein
MRKFLPFFVILLLTSATFAVSLPIVNSDFSAVPIVCGGAYAYQSSGGNCSGPLVPQQDFNGAPGIGWTFAVGSGNGLTAPGTAFNPPTNISYVAAAFLQGNGNSVSQSIPGFVAGNEYELSFYLGSRFFSGPYDGDQTVQALIDGTVIGTWALTSFTPFTLETADFVVAGGGNHTLEFVGVNAGDHTAFITNTTIDPVPEPSTLLMLGSGIVGLAGVVRRKLMS